MIITLITDSAKSKNISKNNPKSEKEQRDPHVYSIESNMRRFNHPFLKLIVDTNKQIEGSGPAQRKNRHVYCLHGSIL